MKLLRKFFALFRKNKLDAEMAEEMRLHLERRTEENIAAGLAPDEARYAALRKFGGVEQAKEKAREQRPWNWLEQALQDFRFALRQLRKTPGFTAVAVLSLALGIGANTAIFSLVDEILLKTLPVRDPHELVVFRRYGQIRANAPHWFQTNDEGGVDPATGKITDNAFSPVVFDRLRDAGSALVEVFAFAPLTELNAVIDDEPEVVPFSQIVSGNYFDALGVPASSGRLLTPADDRPDAAPVAVISHRYWQRRFAEEPTVIGKAVWLNNVAVTIVGVTPANFSGTLQVGDVPDFSLPLELAPRLRPDKQNLFGRHQPAYWWLRVMGRLKTGATAEQVRTQLDGVLGETILEVFPENRGLPDPPRLLVDSGAQGLDETRRAYRRSLSILSGIVGLVLVIACVNVANLLLARAAARRREIAVRLALGASRGRLIRQLMSESVMLALLGGGLGVIFAWWGKDVLLALSPGRGMSDAGGLNLDLDARVLGFTTAVAVTTGIFFGLVPALRATRLDLTAEFQGGAAGCGRGGRFRLARTLMVSQVALSVVLLVGGGLFVRTLRGLQTVNVGFDRTHLLMFRLSVETNTRGTQTTDFYARINQLLGTLPGVMASTFSSVPVLSEKRQGHGGSLPGERGWGPGVTELGLAWLNGIEPGFFRTFGIPIVHGRSFDAHDERARAPRIVIVNQTMARKIFGSEDVIGRLTNYGEIVGVARDSKYYNLRDAVEPAAYLLFSRVSWTRGEAHFAVRTSGDPEAVVAAIRRAVQGIDPKLALFDVRTQEAQVGRLMLRERLFAQLSGFFGVLALGLVCIGLYGLMSFAVLQRTGEIGIRMALGALPRWVLWMIVREASVLVGWGMVIGLAGAWAASRLVVTQLFALSPTDPVTYAGVALLLAGVALLACLLPARRAAKVDPMVALRAE